MDIYFNSQHDMELQGEDIRFTVESEDVAQRLTIRLQFLLAEWFANTALGIPYTQTIFEDGVLDMNAVYSIFRTAIQETTGVETITSLDITIDRDERELTVALVVNDGISVEVSI